MTLHRCLCLPITARRRGAGGVWRALVALTLLTVLMAQWLALVHTVVHAGGRAVWVAEAPQHAAPALVHVVAGHDAGSAACRLLDQLAQAAPGAQVPALALPAALPQGHVGAALAPVLPAEWAAHRARGPPVIA